MALYPPPFSRATARQRSTAAATGSSASAPVTAGCVLTGRAE